MGLVGALAASNRGFRSGRAEVGSGVLPPLDSFRGLTPDIRAATACISLSAFRSGEIGKRFRGTHLTGAGIGVIDGGWMRQEAHPFVQKIGDMGYAPLGRLSTLLLDKTSNRCQQMQ